MLNEVNLASTDLNLLVVFEAVFELRHVASAAKRLSVSPSAVSHGLKRLREMFEDPLFLRTPKGVLPSERARELAPSISEILGKVRGVMGSVEPFRPETSARRFRLGAPDAVMAIVLPRLIAAVRSAAPGVDLSTRHLLPMSGLDELESGEIDVMVLPVDEPPARFFSKVVDEEEFEIAARASHAFFRAPTLRAYCRQLHAVVSIAGDHNGYIDRVLAEKQLSRRVALSIPNFMLALATLAETDLLAAVPGSLVAMHGPRFGVASVKAPLPLQRWQLRAIATQSAMADAGVAWLFEQVVRAARPVATASRTKRRAR